MPSRDQYGNEIYSQGEYEHHIMMGIPFTGFVDGVGYVLSEVVVTPYPINKSGTHFMFDINLIGYTFDMSDMAYNSEPTLSDTQSKQNNNTTDRIDYATLPRGRKFDYADDWYNPINVATFMDNVVIDLVNPIIDMVNGAMVSTQIGLNEGFDEWWEYEKAGLHKALNAPIDFATNHYNYMTNTPASQQWDDFVRDISSPHNWESGVAMGIGLYAGGRVTNTVPKIPKVISIQRANPQHIKLFNYYIKPLREKGTGKLSGFTISKKPGYGAHARFDFERIFGPSKAERTLTIPNFLKNKPLPHWHRGKGNNLRYHRPWELGPDGKRRW